MATQTKNVQAIISDLGVTMAHEWTRENPNIPDHAGNNWRVTMKMRGDQRRQMSLYFSTGAAIPNPILEDVLWCLIQDSHCVAYGQTFDDFCSELGYDSDSRSAERIYKAIKSQSSKLSKFLGMSLEEIVQIEEE